MFFKDFVSVKRQKIKRGASQTYDTPSFFCFSQAKTHKNPYIYNKISDKVQLFQKNFMMEKGEKNKGVSRMPDEEQQGYTLINICDLKTFPLDKITLLYCL